MFENENNIGKYIRLVRIQREIAVKDVAARMHISPSYLSKIETGKKRVPDDDNFIIALASILSLDASELYRRAIISDVFHSSYFDKIGERKQNILRLLKISEKIDDEIFIKACMAFINEVKKVKDNKDSKDK